MKNDRENYRMMNIDERIKLIEKLFIMHPSFERCYNIINECHEHSKVTIEPDCALIEGEPGVGKTTLCEKYLEAHPRIELEEKTKVPVLLASIPIPLTPRNMVTAILIALGDPLADKGTAYSRTIRLFKLLKECEVEIIILDEFHHIVDKDSDKVLHTVSDWLKQLINEAKLPIMLVGLPHSVKILDANSQLKRRFSRRDELTDFIWISDSEQQNFNKEPNNKRDDDYRFFLRVIDDALPLADNSSLASKKMAFPMWKATKGNVNRTMKLVRSGAKLALEKGEERITLECLKESYKKHFPDEASDNPFAA